MTDLRSAVTRLVEAERNGRKDRDMSRLTRETARAARAHFRAQREDLMPRLDQSISIYFEETLYSVLDRTWHAVVSSESDELADVIQSVAQRSMALGFESAALDVGTDIAFDLNHPRTIEFLRDRGAERVSMIDDATRETLNRILVDGRERGQSWAETSRRISDRFEDFGRERADLIAITETSDAYEQGRLATAETLESDGLTVEKRWLALGGDPCDVCEPNSAQGWIDRGELFASGDDAPLAHPRCRCDLELRVVD